MKVRGVLMSNYSITFQNDWNEDLSLAFYGMQPEGDVMFQWNAKPGDDLQSEGEQVVKFTILNSDMVIGGYDVWAVYWLGAKYTAIGIKIHLPYELFHAGTPPYYFYSCSCPVLGEWGTDEPTDPSQLTWVQCSGSDVIGPSDIPVVLIDPGDEDNPPVYGGGGTFYISGEVDGQDLQVSIQLTGYN